MKLAIAQINPTVGDIPANSAKIKRCIQDAQKQHADLVVFGELSMTGYPPRDLLLKPSFIDDNIAALKDIAGACRRCGALVGYACRHEAPTGKSLHNAAAFLADGKVQASYYKLLLPSYDVFDETRYFEPAKSQQIIGMGPVRIGLTICEDIWNPTPAGAGRAGRLLYEARPFADLAAAGVDLVINMSASPFVLGKHEHRCELFGRQCAEHRLPLLFVNQVGGNDELVFDGCSCFFNRDGELVAQAKDFQEDMLIIDLDDLGAARTERIRTGIGSVRQALVLGLGDYVAKCGFKTVLVGLSGGIDSAVTAALAAEALGPERVTGVAMPSRYSSDHSLADARKLAENLGIGYMEIPIEPVHAAMEQVLSPAFRGLPSDVTEENIQARIRGNILMALSNKFGHLLLTTGNKSELAVGYCTIYGDMAGGLAVISDVPKTMVYELAGEINRRRRLIPDNCITKPPSAELRPGQADRDSLPAYEDLDAILQRYVELERSAAEIVAEGFDGQVVERVVGLVDRSEYKRRQAAPGLKVTSRAFGFGRRMPIAQKYRR